MGISSKIVKDNEIGEEREEKNSLYPKNHNALSFLKCIWHNTTLQYVWFLGQRWQDGGSSGEDALAPVGRSL